MAIIECYGLLTRARDSVYRRGNMLTTRLLLPECDEQTQRQRLNKTSVHESCKAKFWLDSVLAILF